MCHHRTQRVNLVTLTWLLPKDSTHTQIRCNRRDQWLLSYFSFQFLLEPAWGHDILLSPASCVLHHFKLYLFTVHASAVDYHEFELANARSSENE